MCRVIFFLMFLTVTNANVYNYEECKEFTVYPVQYDLIITPYMNYKDPYYICELSITIIAHVLNVQVIELECRDLEIDGSSIMVLYENRDIVNKLRPYDLDHKYGKLRIYLKEPLKVSYKNNYNFHYIKMRFRKIMTEDSEGAFMVKYKNEYDKQEFLYMTRLSPDKAKYFFPCFDTASFEPIFKFTVYVVAGDSTLQYTNTSLVIAEEMKKETRKDKTTLIEYLPSPYVQLHQVCFVYSKYTSIKAKSNYTDDTISVWAPQYMLGDYECILNFGVSIINLIHEYSKINRRLLLGPINIVSVPKIMDGYEIGSWNLLTNGLNRLLDIEFLTSIQQKERSTFELTQQLSRIWLGNPGEPERTRWKEEWFKEGMATYLAYYFLNQYHQEEQMNTRYPFGIYGLQMKHKAMAVDWKYAPALDIFNTSLAIEIPPKLHMELVTMKTGALLWMLENWVESKRFHYFLVNYINSRRGQFISLKDFKTTLDQDTVDCFNQYFNGSTASRILESWIHQPGYPVIDVQVLRDRTPNAIILKQRKFSFTHENRFDSDYLIPISYVIQNSRDCYNCHKPRFTIGKQPYTFGEKLQGGWIILNRNASGYYRVNYDVVTWRLIATTLKENFNLIDELNRAQIVNDVLALYAAGDLDIDLVMNILGYLDIERSHVVWDSVISGFELLKIDGAGCNMTQALYHEWEVFMAKMVSGIYTEIVDKNYNSIRFLRSKIIEFACLLDYEPCLQYARSKYVHHVNGQRWIMNYLCAKFHQDPFSHFCVKDLDPDSRVAEFYVMGVDSREPYISSLFDKEDKIIAEHKLRQKKMFLIKIPPGDRRPEKIMSTETIPVTSTEMTGKPEHLRGSSASYKASLVIPIIFIYILSIVR